MAQSAEQGHAGAQAILGVAYATGEGIIADAREAYIWYSIAKAKGVTKSRRTSLRTNKWHLHLTAAEIKAAKREAAKRMAAIDRGEFTSN